MKVLIAGGAGYIGSTIASACDEYGIEPIILDNLSTGRREFAADRVLYEGDIADGELIDTIFSEHTDIDVSVHCAAKIVVPESVERPIDYYRENVAKTNEFVSHLLRNGGSRIVYSSSASIYQSSDGGRVDESCPISPGSPYARTKAIVEEMLHDYSRAYGFSVVSLRYFNPIGADPQLRSGHQVADPSHVLGKLTRAHHSDIPFLLTGTRWSTRDGSAIRDYIHVWDLAMAHVRALRFLDRAKSSERPHVYEVLNIGTGHGTTVREFIAAFERVVGVPPKVEEAEARPGDVIGCYTDTERAEKTLDWTAELSIEDAIRDHLRWCERRPVILGY